MPLALRLMVLVCLALMFATPLTVAQDEGPPVAEGRYIRATLLTPSISAEPQQPMVADVHLETLVQDQVRVLVTIEGPGGKWIAQDAPPVTLDATDGRPAFSVPLTIMFHPGGGVGKYAETAAFTIRVEAAPVDSEAAPDRLALTLDAESGGVYMPGPGALASGLALLVAAFSSSRVRPSSPR